MGFSNPDAITLTVANQKGSERYPSRAAARLEIVRVLKLIAIEDTDEARRESARVVLQVMSANTNVGSDEDSDFSSHSDSVVSTCESGAF